MTTRKNKKRCGNQHGYHCPDCKSSDHIRINAEVTAELLPDGCNTEGDTEWGNDSTAWCAECDWVGKVEDLKVRKVDDDSYYVNA